RQYRQTLRLRLRPARAGGAAVAARLRPGHRADAGRRNGVIDLPTRAVHGTGITPGQPVNSVVLSGVRGIVLSGVALSCYQACQSAENPRQHWVCALSNIPNLNSLTFSREAPLRWTTATRPQTAGNPSRQKSGFAGDSKQGFPARRAAP